MKTTHTPGPWKVLDHEGDCLYVGYKNGNNYETICNLYYDSTPCDAVTQFGWDKPFDNAEANARLIASAPELLEALKLASAYIFENVDQEASILDHLNNVIAKAEGTQCEQ